MKWMIWQNNRGDGRWGGTEFLERGDWTRDVREAGRFTKEQIDESFRLQPSWFKITDLTILPAPEWLDDARYVIFDDECDDVEYTFVTGYDHEEHSVEWGPNITDGRRFTHEEALIFAGCLKSGGVDVGTDAPVIMLAPECLPGRLTRYQRLPEHSVSGTDAPNLLQTTLNIIVAREKAEREAKGALGDPGDALTVAAAKSVFTRKEIDGDEGATGLPGAPWADGCGHVFQVHLETKCAGGICPIHNPSGHHLRHLPQHYNLSANLMVRICDHGIEHPDPDDPTLIMPPHLTIHTCCLDQCCWPEYMREALDEDEDEVGYAHTA